MTRKGQLRPRFLPVVIAAASGLLVLKVLGLATQGGYVLTFGGRGGNSGSAQWGMAPHAVLVPAPDGDITGSTPPPKADKPKEGGKDALKDAPKDGAKPAEVPPQPLPPPLPSAAERDILEKLAQRRKQLDERMKELEMRESMLKSAEKMLDDKLGELKDGESKNEASRAKDDGAAPLKSLVVMYEAMKPRDAARVFEKMDARTLTMLARQMNPRKLSEILAQMTPDAAEKLTSALIKATSVDPAAPAQRMPTAQSSPTASPTASPAAVPELQRLDAPTKIPRS